ncbi:hypothetical protein M758_3G145900 [Ceratodon purpureus]|nr:hypothetical protein M758_3G145900 [Ceratodon purpureus]
MEENVVFRFNFAAAATPQQEQPQPQSLLKNSNALGIAAEQPLLPPPPPSEEVFPSEAEESTSCVMEPIALQGGMTLLKGRVNSQSILKVSNSDLVPGKYEGGLKLWECTIDLVETLRREIQDGQLSFRGKRVLELGCGHGLPGIFACLKGASSVHFQDFNAEVLRNLTIKNVQANLEQARGGLVRINSVSSDGIAANKGLVVAPDIHYYAGDWSDVHDVLSVVRCGSAGSGDNEDGAFNFRFNESDLYEPMPESGDNEIKSGGLSRTGSKNRLARKLSGSQACERGHTNTTQEGGYDIILMSETVYSLASLPKLYELIKKCIRPPYGVVYVAGKKHYFGVGGGTRQFKHLVEDDGTYLRLAFTIFHCMNVSFIWKVRAFRTGSSRVCFCSICIFFVNYVSLLIYSNSCSLLHESNWLYTLDQCWKIGSNANLCIHFVSFFLHY